MIQWSRLERVLLQKQDKLSQRNVPDSTCRWITDFLTDRRQCVRLGKNVSDTRTISTGAPQGCVLSPLLFSLYTNCCTSSHGSVKLIKFAFSLIQVQIRSGFCSMAPSPDKALYEFRVYDVQPHLYTRFLQLTNQKIHLRTAHSQLIGYWSVEYGALNQVFHIWKYESFSQRAAVRSFLAQDPDWLEQYISKAIPMLTKQNNEVARLLPWQPLQAPPKEGGVFDLQRFHIRPKGWGHSGRGLKDYIQSQHAPGLCQVIGTFSNYIGQNNIVQVLCWFQSPDHWAETRDRCHTALNTVEHLESVTNKLLFPLQFSPMK